MKNLNIAFWLNVVLAIIMLLSGVELLSIIPFILFSYFVGMMVYKKRDFKVAGIVLSIVMAVLNLVLPEPSSVDVLVWVVNAILLTI